MLDKSVEYKNIIMRCDDNPSESLVLPELPMNFTHRLFTPTDIKHWGRVLTSVLEFDSEDIAMSYFEAAYMPYIEELQKRCIFVLNPDGIPIATATAWFAESELGHQASLHWVAVCPEYQGKGFGKFVTVKALKIFSSLEPKLPIWLHTQTWSHVAVRLYRSLGFSVVRNGRLANNNTGNGKLEIYENDFPEALHILKSKMSTDFIEELFNTSI